VSAGVVLRAALADAAARRTSFWTQIVAMALNDVAWVAFWLLFFHRVGSLAGWDAHRVLLLFAVLTTAGGLVLGLLSNSRRVPQLIADGELDVILTLPVAPLPHLLIRRVDTVNLGDVCFGLVLFAVAGHPTPGRIVLFVFGVATGVVLFAGFLVAIGSLAFFAGRGEAGGLGLHAMLLLSSYPVDIFRGSVKALLYTAVPAAFVAAVPASLIDRPTPLVAGAMLGAAGAFAVLGWSVFTVGLRRYTSGSAWSRP
jgi:ABC-2 type transport system permease protein